MKLLKFGVLVCAFVGLVAAFLPYTPGGAKALSFFQLREIPGYASEVFATLAGFVAALLMAGIAIIKQPMRQWQGIVAVVGFAWIIVKLRHGFTNLITDGGVGAKLIAISALLGVAFAILCVAKPETAK